MMGYQSRKFGPAASTIVLATHGGARLGGIWVSAKGSAPTVAAFDDIASVTASTIIPSTAPAAVGFLGPLDIGCGTGLTVKVASATGAIFWQPASA